MLLNYRSNSQEILAIKYSFYINSRQELFNSFKNNDAYIEFND